MINQEVFQYKGTLTARTRRSHGNLFKIKVRRGLVIKFICSAGIICAVSVVWLVHVPAEDVARDRLATVTIDDPAAAIEFWKAAIENDPANHIAYNKLGLAYFQYSQPEESLRCFKKSIVIKADYAETYVLMGGAYRAIGKYHEAIEYLEKAVALGSDDLRTFQSLGLNYFSAGEYAQAIRCFERVLDKDPEHAEALLAAASAYKAAGEPQKAKEKLVRLKDILLQQGKEEDAAGVLMMISELPD